MNSLVSEHMPDTFFGDYLALRDQLLDAISDADLDLELGGTTRTIGWLCRELGEVERSYIDSFRTFRQDFEVRHPDPGVEHSVAALRAWFEDLDRELRATVEAIPEDVIVAGQRIDRGSFSLSLAAQLDVFREALVIFYGKVSIYLRAKGRPLPGDWEGWIS